MKALLVGALGGGLLVLGAVYALGRSPVDARLPEAMAMTRALNLPPAPLATPAPTSQASLTGAALDVGRGGVPVPDFVVARPMEEPAVVVEQGRGPEGAAAADLMMAPAAQQQPLPPQWMPAPPQLAQQQAVPPQFAQPQQFLQQPPAQPQPFVQPQFAQQPAAPPQFAQPPQFLQPQPAQPQPFVQPQFAQQQAVPPQFAQQQVAQPQFAQPQPFAQQFVPSPQLGQQQLVQQPFGPPTLRQLARASMPPGATPDAQPVEDLGPSPAPQLDPRPFAEAHWQGLEAVPKTPTLAAALKIPPDVDGVILDDVTLPGDLVGFRAGDLVTAVNGVPTPNLVAFIRATDRVREERRVAVDIIRAGAPQRIEMVALMKRLGTANGETPPMIPPGARRPHPYMGPCLNCHRIGNSGNLAADQGDTLRNAPGPVRLTDPAPHRDRGACAACHPIIP